ncbi:STAS/SEC14 domain-containing protein [Synechococcus sp. ATX 2A4]|uniref:STAS/SEC14 domain-containing protein n=1 Tax=Synechococcus sp. ATX 2A4 TaxID=2823727 RepID=UPI0020CDEEDE|nr:STAS/SEC14 domain-containing protein [Synechococcus sp. ATX 2A4]
MIETIEGLPEGTLGFQFRGKITAGDYNLVLTPALDRALEEHHRVKALACLGDDFEGFSLGAAWEDTQEGLRHWDGFERLAVVTDVAWMRHGLQAVAVALPYPVRVFGNAELQEARRWLSEALGTIQFSRDADVVTVRLIGSLDAAAYARAEEEIAAAFAGLDGVRVLLELSAFDGWAGLGALSRHLGLIRDHQRSIRRVALVGNRVWQKLAEKATSRFITAETRFFDSADAALAEVWIRQ